MSIPQLTAGAVRLIYESNAQNLNPTLQILDLKKIANETAKQDRFRLVISDGQNSQQAMLATQMNHLVTNNELTKFHIVKVHECLCNVVQNRRIVIILKMELLCPYSEKIGNPVSIDSEGKPVVGGGGGGQPPPQQQQAAPMQSGGAGSSSGGYQQQQSYHQDIKPSYQQQPPQQQQQQQNRPMPPQQQFSGRGPVVAESAAHIQPISMLNPYQQNRWTIKARVVVKSPLKQYKNDRGEGRLFSIDMMDESGEIRGTFFNTGVDKFYDVIQPDNVYVISSRGALKIANKKFSSLHNDYEITFSDDSTFERVQDDASAPKIRYNFVDIAQLENVPKDTVIDILGVVESFLPITSITAKTGQNAGRQISKRTLKLVDRTSKMVDLTLWEDNLDKLPETLASERPIIAVKTVRVSDFGGRSLSTTRESHVEVNPDMREAHALRGWYDSLVAQGGPTGFSSIGGGSGGGGGGGGGNMEMKNFAAIKEQNIGAGEKPEYFRVRGIVTFIKHDDRFSYPACPSTDHKTKVTQQGSSWNCDKCQRIYTNCDHRYIMLINGSDHTGNHWLSCFNDQGQQLMLGTSANELHNLKENNQEAEFEDRFQEALFRHYVFKIRAKSETYQDEARLKCQIIELESMDFAKEGHALLQEIKQL